MLKQSFILAVFILCSCGQSEQKVITTKEDKLKNALTFINNYIENSYNEDQGVNTLDWVTSNSLATKGFKTELKKIIDEAYKLDPELGLDVDPILDAQDSPSEGFELDSYDENTNYLIVKGKDWPEFKLTMKITEKNGNWLVDGCGIVNIPNDKRSKR